MLFSEWLYCVDVVVNQDSFPFRSSVSSGSSGLARDNNGGLLKVICKSGHFFFGNVSKNFYFPTEIIISQIIK